MKNSHMDLSVKTLCVRDCCLDENDICLGCYRHLDEITGWHNMSLKERASTQKVASDRKKSHEKIIPYYLVK